MYFYERMNPRVSSALDLARWIAAEIVLLNHIRSLLFVSWGSLADADRGPVTALFYALSSLGHMSVVIFFVLSGFLVGGSMVGELRTGRFSLRRYLVNRVSRLYVVLLPALVLGWTLDMVGSRLFADVGIYTQQWPSQIAALQCNVTSRLDAGTFFANAANLQTILAPTLGSNGPLWSLANEFWYYVLFPLLVLPWISGPRSIAMRCATVVAAGIVAALVYPEILLYGSIWLVGVAVRWCPRAPIPWPWFNCVIVIIAAIAATRLNQSVHGQLWLFALDFGVALCFGMFLLSLMHHRRSVALPGARAHAQIAGFSYSLYLLHFPFVLFVCACLQSNWGIGLSRHPGDWHIYLITGGLFVAANVYGWLMSLITERHTPEVRGWLGRRLMPAGL